MSKISKQSLTPEKQITIEDTIERRIGKNQIVLKAGFDSEANPQCPFRDEAAALA